jgi:hypothetical protein
MKIMKTSRECARDEPEPASEGAFAVAYGTILTGSQTRTLVP